MLLVPDTPLAPPSGQAGALRAQVAELEAENAGLREAATARDEVAAAHDDAGGALAAFHHREHPVGDPGAVPCLPVGPAELAPTPGEHGADRRVEPVPAADRFAVAHGWSRFAVLHGVSAKEAPLQLQFPQPCPQPLAAPPAGRIFTAGVVQLEAAALVLRVAAGGFEVAVQVAEGRRLLPAR